MSRLKIVHTTGLRYAEAATASYNEARMLPRTRDGQFVLRAGLDVTPAGAQSSYTDFWGTHVSTFEVLIPHEELRVTATSLVDIRPVVAPARVDAASLTGPGPMRQIARICAAISVRRRVRRGELIVRAGQRFECLLWVGSGLLVSQAGRVVAMRLADCGCVDVTYGCGTTRTDPFMPWKCDPRPCAWPRPFARGADR